MLVYLNAFVRSLVWRLGGNISVSKQYMKKKEHRARIFQYDTYPK